MPKGRSNGNDGLEQQRTIFLTQCLIIGMIDRAAERIAIAQNTQALELGIDLPSLLD
jgi:hypothetical protein